MMPEKNIFIIFRNDDVSALNDPVHERKVLKIFEKHGIFQVLSTIPKVAEDPHDHRLNLYHRLDENPNIIALITEYYGKGLVEVAQHGYTHQTNEFHPSKKTEISENEYCQGIHRKWLAFSPANTHGYSEFNGLSYDEIIDKITCGRRLLEESLKIKVETFAFPWDSLDQQCLDVLDNCGFKTVLCTNNTYESGKLNLITCCHNDIFSLPEFIKEMEASGKPTLTHIEYHSWMLSGDELKKLDNILSEVSSNRNVKIITASQVNELFSNFQKIRRLKRSLDILTNQANEFLGPKTQTPKYFVMNRLFYAQKIAKTWILYFFRRFIGYKKTLIISGLSLILFVLLKFKIHLP